VTERRNLKLNDDDLRALEGLLMENPMRGAVVAGTGGLRKLRFAPPSQRRGKSAASRVGYCFMPMEESAILVVIYAKNEKSNLTPSDKKRIKAALDRVKQSMRKDLE
jgi:hypothetical protein